MNQEQVHICSNCGASFPLLEAYCPFCGVINPHGAEEKHMKELRQIRSDLEELGDDHQENLQKEMKILRNKSGRLFLRIAAVLLVLIAAFTALARFAERMYQKEVDDETAFISRYYPELDALAEEHGSVEEDELVLSRLLELRREPGSFALYDWEPYEYYRCLINHEYLADAKEDLFSGKTDKDDLSFVIGLAYDLTRDRQFQKTLSKCSAERREKLERISEDAEDLLKEILLVDSSEEVDAFFEEIADEYVGYDHKKLKEKAELILKERNG